jgi:hypothetical protein
MQTLANSSICDSELSLTHGHKAMAVAMVLSSAGDRSLAATEAAATTLAQVTAEVSKLSAAVMANMIAQAALAWNCDLSESKSRKEEQECPQYPLKLGSSICT